MGEQTLLELDDDILTKAEKQKAEEEKNEPKKKTRKKAAKPEEEGSPESSESPSEDGEIEQGGTGESKGRDSKPNRRKAETSREPVTRADGWNINIIGTPPKKNPNPYFEGLIAYTSDSRGASFIPFKDIQYLTRIIYVDDIHLENPTVIEKKFYATGKFYDVVVRVSESEFNELSSHKEIKGSIYYSYVSCERNKKRNYQLKNDDRWPTDQEIKEMDKHMDSVDYALMGYHEREQYKEAKRKKGEVVEEVVEEEIPLPVEEEFEEPESEPEEQEEAEPEAE